MKRPWNHFWCNHLSWFEHASSKLGEFHQMQLSMLQPHTACNLPNLKNLVKIIITLVNHQAKYNYHQSSPRLFSLEIPAFSTIVSAKSFYHLHVLKPLSPCGPRPRQGDSRPCSCPSASTSSLTPCFKHLNLLKGYCLTQSTPICSSLAWRAYVWWGSPCFVSVTNTGLLLNRGWSSFECPTSSSGHDQNKAGIGTHHTGPQHDVQYRTFPQMCSCVTVTYLVSKSMCLPSTGCKKQRW